MKLEISSAYLNVKLCFDFNVEDLSLAALLLNQQAQYSKLSKVTAAHSDRLSSPRWVSIRFPKALQPLPKATVQPNLQADHLCAPCNVLSHLATLS